MRTHEIELQRYRAFRPTQFDQAGLEGGTLSRQLEWFVGPCSQTRDSTALDLSNFASLVKAIESVDKEGNDHEVQRFGHWGPGWFEIVLVRPDSPAHREAQECAAALASYPVLDYSDFSEREAEECEESWGSYGKRELVRSIAKSDATRNFLDEKLTLGDALDIFTADQREDGGAYYAFPYVKNERAKLANWIKAKRKEG